MEVIKTAIDGVLIIEPKVFGDKRGYFFESFSQREFDEKIVPILGHTINFVQDNESMSSYGVMRVCTSKGHHSHRVSWFVALRAQSWMLQSIFAKAAQLMVSM